VIRTFIAVKISESSRHSLSELIGQLRESRADVKWVTPENAHLTLKFLGDVDEKKIDEIAGRVSAACQGTRPFKMSLTGLGAFPNARRPSVIWVGVDEGRDSLADLNEKIERELEKMGFERERRKFSPHLTIGRLRRQGQPGDLGDRLTAEYGGGDSTVDRVFLMKSTLTPKGPVYEELRETILLS
jgi:2'-5' RNA ligase